MDGLIDDIGEGFGHLDSILGPASRDKVDGVTDIGGGKLGWTTSSGFLQVRTLLGTKSRDGRIIKTSGRCNSMGSITRIKHGEDGVLLGG